MDITERKQLEEKLKFISFHDPLTGLYNRYYFEEEFSRLENCRCLPVALIIADLDGLKYVNDTLGHKMGDEYIKVCGTILKSSVRKSDVVARIGGDEFGIILPKSNDIAARKVISRINDKICKFNLDEKKVFEASMSIGFAVSSSKELDRDKLFREADNAMYADKQRRKKIKGAYMHEVRLGFKIKDYLTGEEIDATTYEDLRQDIAKIIVKDKGYPRANIKSKVQIEFDVDKKRFVRSIDFTVCLEDRPVAVIIFCAGEIETYVREAVSLARLIKGGPARLSIVTDTQKFIVSSTKDGEILLKGPFDKFPTWENFLDLLDKSPEFTLDVTRLEKEKRILYALSQISCECRDSCNL